MMTKVSSAALKLGIGFALGALEGQENAAADRRGVLERLEAGREPLPFVMAEIGVPRAGRHHQRVEFDRVAVLQQNLARGVIDADDRAEQGRNVLALVQRGGESAKRSRTSRAMLVAT